MAMNLGNAQLKHVNSSRPQLHSNSSQRSIAASDDFYSFSEASAENSSDEKTTVIRYQTPPSRRRSSSALRGHRGGSSQQNLGSSRQYLGVSQRQQHSGSSQHSLGDSRSFHSALQRMHDYQQTQIEAADARSQYSLQSTDRLAAAQDRSLGVPGEYREEEPAYHHHYQGGPVQIHSTQRPLSHSSSNSSAGDGNSTATPSFQHNPPSVPPRNQSRPRTADSSVLPSSSLEPAHDDNAPPIGAAIVKSRTKSSESIVELPPIDPNFASNVRFAQQQQQQRTIDQEQRTPPPSDMKKTWHASKTGVRPPTPGVDDTPYIQFAIDQLTRDEEAMGRSRDPRDSIDDVVNPAYAPPLPTADDYEQEEEDHDQRPSGEMPLISAMDFEKAPTPPKKDSPKASRQVSGGAAAPTNTRGAIPAILLPAMGRPENLAAPANSTPRSPSPVVLLRHINRPDPFAGENMNDLIDDDLLPPVLPPADSFRYPHLKFVPQSLSLVGIGIMSLVLYVLIALLVASMVYSSAREGLWNWDGVGTGRYFLAQYLPPLLAVAVLMGLQIIQIAVQRILPYALMAAKDPKEDVFSAIPLYLTNFLIPNRSLFRKGELFLGYFAVSSWLVLFTVPLASALYQPRFFPSQTNSGPWHWATVQPVAIIMVVFYANLIISLVFLYLRFHQQTTGLKWDPVSLADILVLMRRTTEISPGRPERPVSLGYWQSPSQPGTFFHGMASAHTPTKLQLEGGKAVLRTTDRTPPPPPRPGLPERSIFESWATNTRKKSNPAYLRSGWLVLYAAVAVALLVAFLAASYARGALLAGFPPRLPTATRATSSYETFSPSNFLFGFLPGLLGLLPPLLWAPLDMAARFLTPYFSLARAGSRGVAAERSLLLSYPYDGPLAVIPKALMHGHHAVVVSATLQLFAWTVPVLAGGLFTAQYVDAGSDRAQIAIRAEANGLGALTAFLVVIVLGWVAAAAVGIVALGGKNVAARKKSMSRSRDLEKGGEEENGAGGGGGQDEGLSLHDWFGDADVRLLAGIRDVIQEDILSLRVWREPRSKVDLVGRLVGSGRGRWSWSGEGRGLQRIGVQEAFGSRAV